MANVTLAQIKQRLADIQPAIDGVARAYVEAPRTVVRADMPAFVNLLGDGTVDTKVLGSDALLESRNLRLLLMVAPATDGMSGELEARLLPLIDATYAFLLARPSLSHLPLYPALAGVFDSYITGDSGPSVITYQDQQYLGVEFRQTVMLLKQRFYAESECPPEG